MTAFTSDVAFNINTFNLNIPFQGPYTLDAFAGSTFTMDAIPLVIGTQSISVPGFVFGYDTELDVFWGVDFMSTLLGNNLTYTAEGTITGGTALAFASFAGETLTFGFAGLSQSAAQFSTAMHTAATADDRAYVAAILAGDDLIALSAFGDVFNSGAGRDLIVDDGGADRIDAGAGNDLVLAGTGNDRVVAGVGDDAVVGGAGDDTLLGGGGNDVLWAGVGVDTLTGGTGADAFLFKAGDGTAKITDFNAAEDQILFMGPQSGLGNLHFAQVGANLRVTFSDVTVILLDTLRSEVTVADVAIGGNAALGTASDAFFTGWDYIA